ncbi:MAG: PLD nuclease N-terminal domain-containing protein [Solirubrobacteraceae bacterium]
MAVLALSNFMHSLFIVLVATPFILLWGAAIVDLIGGQHSGWGIVGWMVVILVLPIVGPLIYFAARKPSRHDVDQAYLAQRDLERSRTGRTTGDIGTAAPR